MHGAFLKLEIDKLPVLCAFAETSTPEICFLHTMDVLGASEVLSVQEERSDTKRQSYTATQIMYTL